MRGQICYKVDGGYFCVLTKSLSHEFDRGGNISHARCVCVGGLCSKVQTQLPCSVLRNVNLFLSLLYSISVESSLGKHSMWAFSGFICIMFFLNYLKSRDHLEMIKPGAELEKIRFIHTRLKKGSYYVNIHFLKTIRLSLLH